MFPRQVTFIWKKVPGTSLVFCCVYVRSLYPRGSGSHNTLNLVREGRRHARLSDMMLGHCDPHATTVNIHCKASRDKSSNLYRIRKAWYSNESQLFDSSFWHVHKYSPPLTLRCIEFMKTKEQRSSEVFGGSLNYTWLKIYTSVFFNIKDRWGKVKTCIQSIGQRPGRQSTTKNASKGKSQTYTDIEL